MRVVVVYQYYQGHGVAGHSLVYEMTQFLADRGHDVTVVSGETGYMQRSVSDLPLYKRIIRKERDGKVNVIRTYTHTSLNENLFSRLLNFLSFTLSCPIGLFVAEKPDVVLASSPPIFPMFTAWLICRLRGIPFVMEVRDLWPESAVQMGILKNKQLIRTMDWMERFLYNKAVKLIALTEGIRDNIESRGWSDEKVKLVTCGVDFDQLYPDLNGAKLIREKYGWLDKKIIMYFGALGEANNLPVTLRAAGRLLTRTDILFVLVGDGMKRVETEKQIVKLGLKNVQILAAVPKEQARLFINAADLCLVTLRDIRLFEGAIPTKLIDYMACGKTVLCGIRGEAQRIVLDAEAGEIFEPDDDEQLTILILELLGNERRMAQMGAAGLTFVQTRFSAITMREQLEEILISVAESDRKASGLKEGKIV